MTGPNLFGNDLFGNPIRPVSRSPMGARFIVPPFSVLDARQGEWQERKRAWIGMGIASEEGRDVHLSGSQMPAATLGADGRTIRGDGAGRVGDNGSTIFDPVVCELAYRWFAPPGGLILDPFAGGSVRGIVAGALGRAYLGVDLRAEQIAANERQREDLAHELSAPVEWACADSATLPAVLRGRRADFVFSCPPYADLERYSDDPRDLSTLDYGAFCAAYRAIIAHAVEALKPDRFACFVVGDLRDPKGLYRNFPGVTVAAFEAAGARLYNEAILVTAVGSLSLRVGKPFLSARKLGKTHQNVLVFVKGDPKRAAAACEVMDG